MNLRISPDSRITLLDSCMPIGSTPDSVKEEEVTSGILGKSLTEWQFRLRVFGKMRVNR